MKKLTTSDIKRWIRTPPMDSENIEKIRTDLELLIDISSNTHPAVTLVLEILNKTIQCNTEIDAFARRVDIAPWLPFYQSTVDKLNKKIEETLIEVMSNINTDAIDINNQESCDAAEALGKLLVIHNAQFADEKSDGQYTEYSLLMNGKYSAVKSKINGYKKMMSDHSKAAEMAEQEEIREEAGKNLCALNDYVNAEIKKRETIIDPNSRAEQFEDLIQYATQKMNALNLYEEQPYSLHLLTEHSVLQQGILYLKNLGYEGLEYTIKFNDEEPVLTDTINSTELQTIGITLLTPNKMLKELTEKSKIPDLLKITATRGHTHKPFRQLLDFLDNTTNRLNEEKNILAQNTVTIEQGNEILNDFDTLFNSFSKKIIELEGRQSRVPHSEKSRYTPVITDANTLLSRLDLARNEFERNRNLVTFTQTTGELFALFQSYESFKTNRSRNWFKTFVFTPFELLKAFVNMIGRFFYKAVYGQPTEANQYKGTLFRPRQTDTSKKLEEFQTGVENLGQSYRCSQAS